MKLETIKKTNSEIFSKYFWYQNPLFLAKDLLNMSQVKNGQIEKQAIYSMN